MILILLSIAVAWPLVLGFGAFASDEPLPGVLLWVIAALTLTLGIGLQ